MTAAIVPFRKGSGRDGPRVRASGRVPPPWHPAADQSETLRHTRQHIAEAWRLKAESAEIKRSYEERQAKIEDLMRRYDVERA